MRNKSLFVIGIFMLSVVMLAAISWAAGEISSAQGDSPEIIALALLFNGLASVGSVVWMAKRYVAKVDDAAEVLPKLVATLTATEKAMESHSRSLKELYESRDEHETQLTRIETIHELRGCNQAIQQSPRGK